MSKVHYNPWEDQKTFVQSVGNTSSILDIISSEGLDTCSSMPDFSKLANILNNKDNNKNQPNNENENKDNNNINFNNEDMNSDNKNAINEDMNINNNINFKQSSILPLIIQNEYSTAESIIEALGELYKYNTIQYNKLENLELIYEKYKYQNILNSQKNYELSQKLEDLSNFFQDIKQSKSKLTYLLHNSGMTDSNVIKIKHGKKMELIKTLKLCCNKNNPVMDMIELYENMHENTLNKLKEKINDKEKKANELIKEFNEIQNIK